MNSKIKVALCLSGEPRSSMASFPYIYESFLQPDPDYEVDVYIHSWKNFRSANLYNPKKIKLEPRVPAKIRTLLTFPHNSSNHLNHSMMYYSIRECFRLITEPYNVYIRCRFDLIFESKLVLKPVFQDLIDDKYDIFSLHSEYPTKKLGGVDDQVLICNNKGIKVLSNYYTQIEQNSTSFFNSLNKDNSKIYAEGFLKKYLQKSKIRTIHVPLSNYAIVRSTSIYSNDNFNFLDE